MILESLGSGLRIHSGSKTLSKVVFVLGSHAYRIAETSLDRP